MWAALPNFALEPTSRCSQPAAHRSVSAIMSSIDLRQLSFNQIFQLYAQIRAWAQERNFWGQGNIVGSYSEHLVGQALNLKLMPAANPGFDAQDANGSKYQIKGLFDSENLWAGWKSKDKLRAFDYLVCVIFDGTGQVLRAHVVPAEIARDVAVFGAQKMWWIYFKDDLWQRPGVDDITDLLRRTEIKEK